MALELLLYSENFEGYESRPTELNWSDPTDYSYTNNYPSYIAYRGRTSYSKKTFIEEIAGNNAYKLSSFSYANGADANLFYSKTSRSSSSDAIIESPLYDIKSGDSISLELAGLSIYTSWNIASNIKSDAYVKISLVSEGGTEDQILNKYYNSSSEIIKLKDYAAVSGKYKIKITAHTDAYEYGDLNGTKAGAIARIDNLSISRGSVIDLDKQTIKEGESFSVTVKPPVIEIGEKIYYKVAGLGINEYDMIPSGMSGHSLVEASGIATISIKTRKDLQIEGDEILYITLFKDALLTQRIGDTLNVKILDTSKTPQFTSGYQSISEGDSIEISISGSEENDGLSLYYSITGEGITEGDFETNKLTGEVTLKKEEVKLAIKLADDKLSEETEKVDITFYKDPERTIEISHPNITKYSTKSFQVRDTSKTPPSFKVSTSSSSVSEGGELKTTLSRKDYDYGTIYWQVSGAGITQKDFDSGLLSGYKYLYGDGDFVLSHKIKNDLTTEGREKLEIKFFSDPNKTIQIGDTALVTIEDTSTTRSTVLPYQINDGLLDLDNGDDSVLIWSGKFINSEDAKNWSKYITYTLANETTGQVIQDYIYGINLARDGSFTFGIDLENASSGLWDFTTFLINGIGFIASKNQYNFNELKMQGVTDLANKLELGLTSFTVENKNADLLTPIITSYKLPSQLSDNILDIDAGESPNLVYEFQVADPETDTSASSGFSELSFGLFNLIDITSGVTPTVDAKFAHRMYPLYGYTFDNKTGMAKITVNTSSLQPGKYKLRNLKISDVLQNYQEYNANVLLETDGQNFKASLYETSIEYQSKYINRDEFGRQVGIDPENGIFDFTIINSNPSNLPESKNSQLNSKVEFLSLPAQLSDGIIDLIAGESSQLELSILFPDLKGKDLKTTAQLAWLGFDVKNKATGKIYPLYYLSPLRIDTGDFDSSSGRVILRSDISWLPAGDYELFSALVEDSDGHNVLYYSYSGAPNTIQYKNNFLLETGIDPASKYFEFSVRNNKNDTDLPIARLKPIYIGGNYMTSNPAIINISGSLSDLNSDGSNGSGISEFRIIYIHQEEADQFDFLVTQNDLDSFGNFAKSFDISGLKPGNWVPHLIVLSDVANNLIINDYDMFRNYDRQTRLNNKLQFKAQTGIDPDNFQPFSIINSNDGAATFAVSGTAQVGQILTVAKTADDPDGNGTFAYQWQASSDGNNWSNIGTNAATYILTGTEQSKQIRVLVAYTDGQNFQESLTVSAGTVAAINDGANPRKDSDQPAAPTLEISGNYIQSQSLTAAIVVDQNSPYKNTKFSYIWTADEQLIANAIEASLVLTNDLVGKRIKASVSYTDINGEKVTISSTPRTVQAGFVNSSGKMIAAEVKVEGANLDGGFTQMQATNNPAAQRAVDSLKTKNVELSPSLVNFNLNLPVNQAKPSENQSTASVAIGLNLVTDGLTMPISASSSRQLSYYSVDASTGEATPFTYDSVTRTGASFYDSDGNGTPDLVTLSFVDGGRGDKDGVKNGRIVDPSTAATVTVNPLFSLASDSLLINDPLSNSPAALILNAKITSFAPSVNEIGYIVLNRGETAQSLAFSTDFVQRAQVLFAGLESSGTPSLSAYSFQKSIPLVNGQSIRFFETIDASFRELSAGKSSLADLGSSFKLLSTSIDAGKSKATATSSTGLGFSVELAGSYAGLDSLIGSKQGDLPILDFTALTGQTVAADLSLAREASYNSSFGFYRILGIDGSVKDSVSGAVLLPGSDGYGDAALAAANRVSVLDGLAVANGQATTNAIKLTESSLLAPYAVVNGSDTYFAFGAANADKISHFRVLGTNVIGLEDLGGGGDKDFDDVVFGLKPTGISAI